MAKNNWEKSFKIKLEELLKESFKGNKSLSEELKTYAIKNHLLEDITSFVENEQRVLEQSIQKCQTEELQEKINQIVERKNFFYIGYVKEISYDLWTVEPPKEVPKWQTYTSRHQGGKKHQTFYSHLPDGLHSAMNSLIQSNSNQMFCLNEEVKQGTNGITKSSDKGIVYILEYQQISYNINVVGDCLLNGLKANQLHDIHKTDVTVYPRATTGDLLKSYSKQITRLNADVLIVHVGTYDITIGGEDTIKNMRNFIKKIKDKCPNIIIAISSVLTRTDRKGVKAIVKMFNMQLKTVCKEEGVSFINNDNITDSCLCQKMLLTLNNEGRKLLSENIIAFINSLI